MRKTKKALPVWVKVLIPSVLLLGLVAVFVGVKNYQDAQESTEESESSEEDFIYSTLWDVEVGDIQEIQLTLGSRDAVTLCAKHTDNQTTWYLPVNESADLSSAYSNVISMATMMQVYELICENPTDEQLANYGFDNPYGVLNVVMEDGTHYCLTFGDTAPAGNYAYVRIEGDDNVYCTSKSYKTYIAYTNEDLIGLEVTQVLWSSTTLMRVRLEKKGETPVFLYRYDSTVDYADNFNVPTSDFAFSSPYLDSSLVEVRSDVEDYFFTDVEDIDTVEIINIAATDEELASYGLDKRGAGYAEYYLAVWSMGQETDSDGNYVTYFVSYCFGNSYGDNDEYVYFCEEGSNVVYGVTKESLTQFDFASYDYVRKNVFITSIDDIRSGYFEFEEQGEKYTFVADPYEVTNTEDETTSTYYHVTVNGIELESDSQYRSAVGGDGSNWMRHNREVWDEEPDYVEGKDITVYFKYVDGTERTLVYHYIDEQSYCVQMQDDLWFICASYQFKEFLAAARAMVE